jgi:signal transduction histidine kinase
MSIAQTVCVETPFPREEIDMHQTDSEKIPAGALGQDAWPALEWAPGFWMNLFDELDSPIIVYRPEGSLVWANREAAKLLGLDGMEGAMLPERLGELLKCGGGSSGGPKGREIDVLSENGRSVRRFTLKRLPSGATGGLMLATGMPEKPSENGFSARKGSFGESMDLAGEVSRTVKGPLAGIELYASILEEELDGAGEGGLSAILDEIRLSVREVNEYLTSLESMTRPLSLDLRGWNVRELVDEALEALNGLFKTKAVGVLVEQHDMTVECDRSLMVQTFLNILLNALEAMPSGGRLVVREGMNRSGECEVVFTDSGPGVPLNDTKKIFNPFHTTKSQTLGLGLPVSRRIVEAHQGRLVFGNDVTMGARVKVVLPCIPGGEGPSKLN